MADLKVLVGVDASIPEVLMVEIRVAVTDTAHVHGLLRRLGELFDRSSVSFDGPQGEVRVRSEWESRGLVQVLGVVESWLAEDGPDSAQLSVGDRTYTMFGATAVGTSNGRAA